jgi:hypothetical protein
MWAWTVLAFVWPGVFLYTAFTLPSSEGERVANMLASPPFVVLMVLFLARAAYAAFTVIRAMVRGAVQLFAG